MHPQALLEAYGAPVTAEDATPALDGNQLRVLQAAGTDVSWEGAVRQLEGTDEAWSLDVRVAPPTAAVTVSGTEWATTSSLFPLLLARCFGLGLRRSGPVEADVHPWSAVASGSVPASERTLVLEPRGLLPTAVVQLAAGGLLVGVARPEGGDALLMPRTATEVWCLLIELLVTPEGLSLAD